MPYFNGTLFCVDKKEMLRYAGTNPKFNVFPKKDIDAAVREAMALTTPRGIWQIYPYDATTGTILHSPPLVLEGKNIWRHLSTSHAVAVLAVTVGEAIEIASDEKFKDGIYTSGLLLDAAATAITEQLADQVNDFIKKNLQKGGKITTWRFSPGYGDWPVTQQKELCRLIHASEIGIEVTDHYMLHPRKSVTAIIGISTCIQKPTPNKCKTCTLTNCGFRIK